MIEFIAVFLACYIWHALGITIGYHRLLSHRSFSCPKFVEYFWVLAGYLAFEGSPIWWATIHRAHHRYVDTPLDPHSPRFGLKNAHTGWLTKGYVTHINPADQCKDLLKDPLYRFLEQDGVWARAHTLGFTTGFAVRLVILLCFGWVPALASLLAGLACLQIPLMLNVVCHIPKLGYKTYATNDDSVNVWWVGILAMGEGWHNNHHASPGSARTGMRPWEFDLTWLLICLGKRLNLVWRVNEVSHEKMLRLNTIPVQESFAAVPGVASIPVTRKILSLTVPAKAMMDHVNLSTGDISHDFSRHISRHIGRHISRAAQSSVQ